MELVRQAVGGERAVQRVDAVGDVEGRAFVALRQEVAHRPVERARQPDGHAVGGDERKRASMRANAGRVAVEDAAARLVDGHVADAVQGGIEEVHDPADGLEHDRIVPHSMRGARVRSTAAIAWEVLTPGSGTAVSSRCSRYARPG